MKHIVCYSGGHSSALVAIEVVRRYGNSDVVLLNHDIHPSKEHEDIKRFKREVAEYLGLPITYANILGITESKKLPDQFQVCMIAKAFKVGDGTELCTNRLKTAPFVNWMKSNAELDSVVYYGFDPHENDRINHLSTANDAMGYTAEFPRAEWAHTIGTTEEIGIKPPLTYERFKHGNCFGCLKAGLQHWYVVYCFHPKVWAEGKAAEAYIGYTARNLTTGSPRG